MRSKESVQAAEELGSSKQKEVYLSFMWPGFKPIIVPLRLLPGLPRSLQLLPGHPFTLLVCLCMQPTYMHPNYLESLQIIMTIYASSGQDIGQNKAWKWQTDGDTYGKF